MVAADGSLASSEFTPEAVDEEEERVFGSDPLRQRGTIILKVRLKKERRICKKMGFPQEIDRNGFRECIDTDGSLVRHIPVAGPRRYSQEVEEESLHGQSWANWARNARF